jgi:multicomponent Na+:H+ antiporter subunit E
MLGSRLRLLLGRAFLAALAWWALTNGALGWDALIIGGPTIAAAAVFSAALMPRIGWSWRGAIRFFGYFARESLLGGIDVARRAFDPRLPLDPGLVREPLRMSSDVARVMVANTMGLVPGSLTVEVDADVLLVHALDVGKDIRAGVAQAQRYIGDMVDTRPPERAAATPESRGQ